MDNPIPVAHDWDEIFHALALKTDEIQKRSSAIAWDEESRPFSEEVRWAIHLRRIVDEITLFVNGN